MYDIRKLTDDIIYLGCSDRRLALFESAYPIPNGVSYNSYLLSDTHEANTPNGSLRLSRYTYVFNNTLSMNSSSTKFIVNEF